MSEELVCISDTNNSVILTDYSKLYKKLKTTTSQKEELTASCCFVHPGKTNVYKVINNNDNIIKEDTLSLVSNYVNSTSFYTFCNKDNNLIKTPKLSDFSLLQQRKILFMLFDTMNFMHECCNILHLDITPSNILLCNDTKLPKICNFGSILFKSTTNRKDSYEINYETTITHCLQPENFHDSKLYICNNKSDVWSMGLVLFRAYTNVLDDFYSFKSKKVIYRLLEKIFVTERSEIRKYFINTADEIIDIILSMVEFENHKRPYFIDLLLNIFFNDVEFTPNEISLNRDYPIGYLKHNNCLTRNYRFTTDKNINNIIPVGYYREPTNVSNILQIDPKLMRNCIMKLIDIMKTLPKITKRKIGVKYIFDVIDLFYRICCNDKYYNFEYRVRLLVPFSKPIEYIMLFCIYTCHPLNIKKTIFLSYRTNFTIDPVLIKSFESEWDYNYSYFLEMTQGLFSRNYMFDICKTINHLTYVYEKIFDPEEYLFFDRETMIEECELNSSNDLNSVLISNIDTDQFFSIIEDKTNSGIELMNEKGII